jgi:hypothetical protein
MFEALPETVPDCDFEKSWQGTYQLWTCHGYNIHGNFDAGVLHLRKERRDGIVRLAVTQRVALLGGIVNVTEAVLECRNDAFATPTHCTQVSRFEDSGGRAINGQKSRYEGWLEEGRWCYQVNGRRGCRRVAETLSSDWSLFDAVQRLPSASVEARFDLLEHAAVLKPGQRLRYREDLAEEVGDVRLACLSRYGYATVPQEYWVDPSHRLVMVVAYNMVYLLNDDAPLLYERALAERKG